MNLLVLWDIDKTLTRLRPGLPNLYQMAVEYVTGSRYAPAPIHGDGQTDSQIALGRLTELAGLSKGEAEELLPAVMDRLDLLSRRYIVPGTFAMIPGVDHALELVRDAGALNGLFTGNTPTRGKLKVSAAGLLPDVYFGGFARGQGFFQGYKTSRFQDADRVCRAFPAYNLVVVGDSQRDYRLSEVLDCSFWQVGGAHLATDPRRVLGSCLDFTQGQADSFARTILALPSGSKKIVICANDNCHKILDIAF